MTTFAPAAASTAPADTRGFWRRRLIDPLRAQLTRGVTPARLAFTVGLGTACSLFPLLGLTSLLNLAAGVALRLNHPILQTLNQLLGAAHLALILAYVRFGEWLWGADAGGFTVREVVRVFRNETLTAFFQQFGWAGLHALTAWLVTSPLLIAFIAYGLRPLFERWTGKGTA